jgi:hypothetical protein
MSELKFRFNPENLSYEIVKKGIKYYFSQIFSVIALSVVLGIIFFLLFLNVVESPREAKLARENSRLISQYEIMSKKLDQVQIVLDDIQQRDENVYRIVYQADSIPDAIRKAGFGGVNRYSYLEDMNNATLVINTAKKLDIITKQLYIQSKSFDEIIELALRHEDMLISIPSIQPISNKDLSKVPGAFGWRIHPIYKDKRFHEGMDFGAPPGTDVYATGDGIVREVKESYGGYGRQVVITHGFGYETRYAHLLSFNVREGQRVKRGDIIGGVGSTGLSTSPHLHYEVIKKDIKINQINKFYKDITAEQYEKMVHITSNSNQTFD